MTIVATDGQAMWADSQLTQGSLKFVGYKKIEKIHNCLVGCAGDYGSMMAFFDWFRNGADRDDLPKLDSLEALVVTPNGVVWEYDSECNCYEIVEKYAVIGSGSEYALALLDAGKTVEESVKATCNRRIDCGGPLYSIQRDQEIKRGRKPKLPTPKEPT